ncbi:MAG: hypothetical protein ACJATA_000728 [Sphingobacteriales bacterium]|jgi:hypothetical protein
MRKTDIPRDFAVGLYSNGPYNSVFKNNMIVGGFESVTKGYGIQVVHPHQLEMYNNSVHYDEEGKESAALWVDVSREQFFIKNNIFSNYGEGYSVVIERIGNDTITTYESDFNNYFNNGEVIENYDFKEYPTLEN